MTLELLRELDNQDQILFKHMSPEAQDFLKTYGNPGNIQWFSMLRQRWVFDHNINWALTDIRYRHTIVDELANKDKIPFKEMSGLAKQILSGPLFPHVESSSADCPWKSVISIGLTRRDMISNAYRLLIPEKEPTMDLGNPELKIFCKLTREEQEALKKLPASQVEELMSFNHWETNCDGEELDDTGVYRRKPAPKPPWVDIAPALRHTNLWNITTPEGRTLLLTEAPSHAGFIGFVYGAIVCAHLQYEGNSVNPTEPQVRIPDAVRLRQ